MSEITNVELASQLKLGLIFSNLPPSPSLDKFEISLGIFVMASIQDKLNLKRMMGDVI